MRVVLLLYCLPAAIYAMCFIEEDAKGRREVIRNATKVIDEYQCKIDCALMETCLAYFYQAKGTQCVLLGPKQKDPLCLPPAKEYVKYLDDADCPKDYPMATEETFGFKLNPNIKSWVSFNIDKEKYTPCDLTVYKYSVLDLLLPDGTHRTATCDNNTIYTWNKKLETWEYKGAKSAYIRGATCVVTKTSGGDINNDTSICNKGVLPPFPGITTNQIVNISTNTPWAPCPKSSGNTFYYKREDGKVDNRDSSKDFVYCVFGSWFLLTIINGFATALEIIAASCGNSTAT